MGHKFNANDLFILEEDVNLLFPLNLEFRFNPKLPFNLTGPGIYFTYFKDELIYIGYFASNV
jgi:hypothetical protein